MKLSGNTLVALTALNCFAACVCVGSTAYLLGFLAATENPRKTASRSVVPHHGVGGGAHPVFDCARMTEKLPAPKETWGQFSDLHEDRSSVAGENVTLHGRVMHAFPDIMGPNWFHLCDEPCGRVVVVASDQWVDVGEDVQVAGKLEVDQTIAGAYTFPLFLPGGVLSGPSVLENHPASKKGTLSL